jgi:carbon-monoxide dehydrogenase large subunit
MIGTNRYIGSPVERIEDLRFLRGSGEFVGDLRREGMLHAVILRSFAHGRVSGSTCRRAGHYRCAGRDHGIDIGLIPRIPLGFCRCPVLSRFCSRSSQLIA